MTLTRAGGFALGFLLALGGAHAQESGRLTTSMAVQFPPTICPEPPQVQRLRVARALCSIHVTKNPESPRYQPDWNEACGTIDAQIAKYELEVVRKIAIDPLNARCD